MTAMAMQMPSMPPPPPGPSSRPATGAAAPPFATQQPAGRPAGVPGASPGLGASSLSLALPVATQQAAAGGATPRAAPFMGPGQNNATGNAAGGVLAGQGPQQPGILASPSDIPSRVKLADMIPEDGVASPGYTKAVETLSQSLAKNNAAIIELNGEDAALMRCALESSRLYFRSRAQGVETSLPWHASDQGKSSGYLTTAAQSIYCYRAGRSSAGEGSDPPPPCMPEAFRCLGKASRACLSAIARHLQLRSDAFCPLLDDSPLVPGEVSHSVLTAAAHFTSSSLAKTHHGGDTFHGQDVEKGLLRLIASDSAGLQVCDSSGRWYLADSGLGPGDLLLLVGRALHQATAGLRKSSAFRVVPVPLSNPSTSGPVGRISMTFRMVPRDSATIDCTSLAEAGHPVPEGFSPVLVSQFMEGLKAAEALMGNGADKALEPARGSSEPSLRNVLSDPLTGALLEDAKVAPCGHSFGGGTLQRVYETRVCISCGAGVDVNSLVPNYALQAAARAFRREERNRHAQATALRGVKRKKEIADIGEPKAKRANKSNLSILPAPEPSNSSPEATPRPPKGVQYPFAVNERVMIKGNKRTAGKYVGREAVVTNKCLNGWYLVTMVDNAESLRLQYRSLAKATTDLKNGVSEDRQAHSAEDL